MTKFTNERQRGCCLERIIKYFLFFFFRYIYCGLKSNCYAARILRRNAVRTVYDPVRMSYGAHAYAPGQCVISADKNITQVAPSKVVSQSDGGGIEIFVDPFHVIGSRNRYHIVRPSPLSLFLAPGQIIPCDLPQPQRN